MQENFYLQKIRQIVLNFMRAEPAEIYLFGSWAKNKQQKSSDVDIAIEYNAESNRAKISTLREILEESDIPYSVDVVDLQFVSKELRAEIKKDGVQWKLPT